MKPASRLPAAAHSGALAFCVLLAVVELSRVDSQASTPDFGLAVLATACFLPLHLRHVHYGLRGQRAPGAFLTLGGMAAVIVAAALMLGPVWAFMLAPLALSILLVIRPPWSLALLGVVVVGAFVLGTEWSATAYGVSGPDGWVGVGPYLAISVAFRSVTLFVLIWLIAAVRQLDTARATLARRAVTHERSRIGADLQLSLAGALEDVAARARRADVLAAARDPDSERALADLVESSRDTLAQARRIVDAYQRVTSPAERSATAALLDGQR